MKIAVDASVLSPPLTGIGNYTFNLLIELVRRHEDIEWTLYSNREIAFPVFKNVTHFIFPGNIKSLVWRTFILSFILRRIKTDLFWSPSAFLPLFVPRNIPVVLTIYDFVYMRYAMTQPWLRRWYSLVLTGIAVRRANHIVCISKFTDFELNHFFGRTADVIQLPIVHPRFNSVVLSSVDINNEIPALKRNSYFLVVGTLEPRKNILAVLEAYEHLVEKGEILPKLVLVGGKGWKDRAIIERINRIPVNSGVLVLGYVRDEVLQNLYCNAIALLFPSHYEGFGMPIVEAQRCGCPVVTSFAPALIEAAGDQCVTVTGDKDSFVEFFLSYLTGKSGLICRLQSDIDLMYANSIIEFESLIAKLTKP